MSTTGFPGPLSIGGPDVPPLVGPVSNTGAQPALVNSNPDFSPSIVWAGWGLRDPQYMQRIGAGALVSGGYPNQDIGWYMSGGVVCCDQVPSTASATAIAGNQVAASGTAMTLAAAAGGITLVAAGGYTSLASGLVVPANALVIDALPRWLGGGTSGAFAFWDPSRGYGRVVSVTAAAGATGGVVRVRGYDMRGNPQTEDITAVAATTVNGKKGWKFIASATPQFTDGAHNYSVGTADIFEFVIRADKFSQVNIVWNNTFITTNTGFVAADTTSPATRTTGSVRGTYAVQSASDNVKALQITVEPSVANIVGTSVAAVTTGILGVAPL